MQSTSRTLAYLRTSLLHWPVHCAQEMPRFDKDFIKYNFEGSSFVWRNFKRNPAISILGLPLLIADAALLPVRARFTRGRRSDDRELDRLTAKQGMPGSRHYADYTDSTWVDYTMQPGKQSIMYPSWGIPDRDFIEKPWNTLRFPSGYEAARAGQPASDQYDTTLSDGPAIAHPNGPQPQVTQGSTLSGSRAPSHSNALPYSSTPAGAGAETEPPSPLQYDISLSHAPNNVTDPNQFVFHSPLVAPSSGGGSGAQASSRASERRSHMSLRGPQSSHGTSRAPRSSHGASRGSQAARHEPESRAAGDSRQPISNLPPPHCDNPESASLPKASTVSSEQPSTSKHSSRKSTQTSTQSSTSDESQSSVPSQPSATSDQTWAPPPSSIHSIRSSSRTGSVRPSESGTYRGVPRHHRHPHDMHSAQTSRRESRSNSRVKGSWGGMSEDRGPQYSQSPRNAGSRASDRSQSGSRQSGFSDITGSLPDTADLGADAQERVAAERTAMHERIHRNRQAR